VKINLESDKPCVLEKFTDHKIHIIKGKTDNPIYDFQERLRKIKIIDITIKIRPKLEENTENINATKTNILLYFLNLFEAEMRPKLIKPKQADRLNPTWNAQNMFS